MGLSFRWVSSGPQILRTCDFCPFSMALQARGERTPSLPLLPFSSRPQVFQLPLTTSLC